MLLYADCHARLFLSISLSRNDTVLTEVQPSSNKALKTAAEEAARLLSAHAPCLQFFACRFPGCGYNAHVQHAFEELARADGRRLLGHGRASYLKAGECKLCFSDENTASLDGSVRTGSN
jgi:hypothetical protein